MSGLCTLMGLIFVLSDAELQAEAVNPNYETVYFTTPEPTPDIYTLAKSWTTLESALASLPKTMRMNYGLMHTSGSLQGASYKDPRVILFSPTADLVITFNGHESQIGGNRLEAMAFNSKSQSYDFLEIVFSEGKPKLHVNPSRCLACHTDYRVPNWRPYANWNGAYGGMQNEFQNVQIFVENSPFPGYAWFRPDYLPGTEEFEKFKRFSAQQKDHQRYRYLYRPDDQPFWPFGPTMPITDEDIYDFEPLRRLGIGLAFHHAKSIATRLENKNLFKTYPANTIALLIGCPTSTVAPFKERMLKSLELNPLYETADRIGQRERESVSYYPDSAVIYQLMALTGLPPEIWVMDLPQRTNRLIQHDLFIAIGGNEMHQIQTMVGTQLFKQYAQTNPSVQVLPDGPSTKLINGMLAPKSFLEKLNVIIPLYSRENIQNKICVKLAKPMATELEQTELIKPELNDLEWDRVKASTRGEPYALRQCSACHVDRFYGPDVPYIPFRDPRALRAALNKNHGKLMDEIKKRTRLDAAPGYLMPHGPIGLHPSIREELIQYLEKLQ